MRKGSIFQDEIRILKVYAPNKNDEINETKTDKTARRNRWIQYHR